ncbi:tRNA threonylcarbamoyladenosine biosynthesis protein TsaB [Bacillus mesophilus]|uniref:tRNA (Adenosine(37)-N6)-threonylcarbamoyltransferase complex dimerization subunit type 1 TsaB n=1 Tax=Bacillus mesophilus TaxID=1808955 RepID=A0A6M0QCQ7_9BACI|nr:tRNA (adenosine(37)-N6)-threonylcarbamoyltransferase complex dimerization subunit type 1 TsaB [Bacillus mesophilus]MBM7663315.1 tRNA threonylcarbamoyladenosine biosynthesis protein TsaB [Bacillus mesophilus]NEY74096.1 tRNA (adenosine(37)-N6)-threonylcarbamoyltransferase complex dimerization subunit type 1 TsaB [Bacillus mesophilus]
MKILAIDTSTYVMGIALTDQQNVIGEYITNIKKNHSVRLMPAIEQVMIDCDISPNMLDKIVVAKGPGSYTGVRIGVSIAKTLAWSLQVPLVGVSSLEQLAWNGRGFNGYICPVMDARREQLFTGLYQYNGQSMTSVMKDQNVPLEDWLAQLKDIDGNVLFIGNDVPIHRGKMAEVLGDQAVFSSFLDGNPRPALLAHIGSTKEAEDLHTFVPSYLRLAEAEANWLASNEKSH